MTKQWFENDSQYVVDDPLAERAWPTTLSLIRVHKDGTTQSGWGRERFMTSYGRGLFRPKRLLDRFAVDQEPFAFVMRSIPVLCADIDGKNGGIQASRILSLPPTLAETSKSGNGYHLLYRVPEAMWHPEYGYEEFPDANGIIPGVDIRSVGVMFHYPQQRWNQLEIAPLPDKLRRVLQQRKLSLALKERQRQVTLSPEDLAIAQDTALDGLAGPIPNGRRNATLYAIGCELQRLEVNNWDEKLTDRGLAIGMSEAEMRGIVKHVQQYT